MSCFGNKSCARHEFRGKIMEKLREALEWVTKMPDTYLTVDDIDDTLLSSMEEKQKLIKSLEDAKAFKYWLKVIDFMNRLDNVKK